MLSVGVGHSTLDGVSCYPHPASSSGSVPLFSPYQMGSKECQFLSPCTLGGPFSIGGSKNYAYSWPRPPWRGHCNCSANDEANMSFFIRRPWAIMHNSCSSSGSSLGSSSTFDGSSYEPDPFFFCKIYCTIELFLSVLLSYLLYRAGANFILHLEAALQYGREI